MAAMPWLEHLTTRHWLTLHGLVVVLGLLFYVTATHVRRQRRHPSAAVAWVISLALMPYVALPLYLLFGNRKVVRGPAVRARLPAPAGDSQRVAPAVRFQRLAAAMGLPPAVSYEQLAVHADGPQALQALLALIDGAAWTLDLCTFLVGRDAVGDRVTQALVRRAREGLRVRLLLDGVGVYFGGRPRLRQLTDAGVQVTLFVSPWRSPLPGRTNLRNHRKMAIADGRHLWSGGRNLAIEYFAGDDGAHPGLAPWIDLTFDVRGEVARQAQERFEQDWTFAIGTLERDAVVAQAPADATAGRSAQLIPSGPDQSDDTVYSLLISGCFAAQTRIVAVTPYFVPDSTLLMALTLAARRGVTVDLVLPERSNHRLADLARPSALRDMSVAGARVWLTPGMIHAKAVIIDEDIALAGSANLDERSLFLNYELMVAFYDRDDVQGFARWVERQRAGARRHEARPPGFMRELSEGMVRWLVFQL
jgi:cardiolipin synthase